MIPSSLAIGGSGITLILVARYLYKGAALAKYIKIAAVVVAALGALTLSGIISVELSRVVGLGSDVWSLVSGLALAVPIDRLSGVAEVVEAVREVVA